MGSSGQTIDNLERYLEIESKLDLLERTLHWRHMAPTAPDQLHCYPYSQEDPFIISTSPHVYFIGNQKKFETRMVEGNISFLGGL